ncbi:MAG TPA: DUF748 domain-containing protein, partial [Burkholderiaceae bacterium]|nr:DUF748 domain-containing protein [Burkholderiaceae bacterium]
MPLRLRRVLLSLPVLLITGLAAVYLLAGWFAFEPLAKWAVHKLVDERSGYRLEMEHAKFDPIRLSVDLRGVTLAEPAGKPLLTLARLFVDAESRGLLSRTLTFEQVRLVRPVASVELGTDGRLNWLTFIAAVTRNDKAQPTASRESLPRLVIRHFALDSGRIDLADHSIPGGFSTQVDPLNLQLDELSTLPDDTGRHSILARTGLGTDIRWTGSFGLNPVTAAGEIVVNNVSLAWLRPYLETVLGSARVDGNAGLNLGYRAGYANKRFSLQLHDVGAKANRLTLSGGTDADPAVTLDSIALNGGRVDFDNRRVDIGRIAIEGGKVRVVRAVDGKLDVQEWLTRTKSAKRSESVNPANTATTPSTSTRWQVSLGHGDVDRVSLRFIDHGFTAPLAAEAAALKLAFKADATAGDGPFDMKVQALDLGLDGIRLVSGKAGEPWLQVAHAALQNAHASLSSREFGAERVRLSEGRLTASRDAHGRLSLSDVLNRASTGSAASASNSEPGWRYRVDKIEADRFGVRWREESVAPAAMFALEDIEVGAERFSDDPKAVMPVRIAMRVGTGGRGEARGTVMPATGATELQLALHGLNLV